MGRTFLYLLTHQSVQISEEQEVKCQKIASCSASRKMHTWLMFSTFVSSFIHFGSQLHQQSRRAQDSSVRQLQIYSLPG